MTQTTDRQEPSFATTGGTKSGADEAAIVDTPGAPAKGFSKVRKAAGQSNAEPEVSDFDLPAEDEKGHAPERQEPVAMVAEPPHPRKVIVSETLRRAISAADRRRLSSTARPPIVLVIQVPDASWVKPVAFNLGGIGTDCTIIARDGSSRSEHKPSIGNTEVVDTLVKRGRSVVGIAVDPVAILPEALVRSADRTVVVGRPDAAVVGRVLRLCLPGRLRSVIDESVVARLGLDELAACMRKGSTRQEAWRNMQAASAREIGSSSTENAPILATAFEFGDARIWGLELVRDIADLRASRISWSQCLKGAVLYSDTGLGKSTVVASIARAAGIPLIRFSIGEYFGKDSHLGTVLVRQREMFELAAASAPCLLFIDEIDALPSRDRLGQDSYGSSWWMPIVNDFLVRLDSAVAGQREGIVVVGATNAIGRVDPALLRPGRLERAIEIRRPDFAGVVNVLRFHLGTELREADIDDVARLAEGGTSAELMDLVGQARRAARAAGRPLRLSDLQDVVLGRDDPRPGARWRPAVHEAAHAVASIVERSGKLHYAILRDAGASGGRTRIDYEDEAFPTMDWFERRCVVLLAAGAAEDQIIGQRSSGSSGSAASDLARASQFLSLAHASLGLAGNLFYRCSIDDALRTVQEDPDLRRAVEEHLRSLDLRAAEQVRCHRSAIEQVARVLAERRYMSCSEISAIVSGSAAKDSDREVATPCDADEIVPK